MKKLALILIIFLISAPSFAYEVNKVHKINQVNSYQPLGIDNPKTETSSQPELMEVHSLENLHIDTISPTEQNISKENFEQDEKFEIKSSIEKNELTKWDKFWKWAKGKPAPNGINLTLNSYHTSSKRDRYNESHDLIAMQLGGWSAGYFENSHHHTSLFFMAARKVWESKKWHGISIDLQHKTGLLTGYRGHAPNLFNVSPMILPIVGLNYKTIATEFWITPNPIKPIISVTCRIGLPEFKSKHKRELTNLPKIDDLPILRQEIEL